MSFILDALKKSDSERQRQSGPALFEIRKAPPRGGLPFWAIALGALLLVNLVVLAWFMMREPQTAPAQQGAPATAPRADAPAADTPAAATLTPTPTGTPVPAGSPPGVAPQAGTAQVLPPQVAAPAPDLSAGAALAQDDAAYAPPDYSGNPADYEQALPVGPAPDAATQAAERGMVPTLEQLPPAIANQLPPLRLDLHVYATRAADRFVMINMRRLREGDATPEGIRLEEITPSGAVMSFRGTRFQLEQH
ncbi:MAG TPA: general secretion pathway protein GspB [Steroidobacteraceae bacterium]|nr:general secretion pathway protein GspB [Steroidobacteraceae bacterium]HNS27127.1 general secretion pathway protein GspB [Steroidobacteraceae bacterium]